VNIRCTPIESINQKCVEQGGSDMFALSYNSGESFGKWWQIVPEGDFNIIG